jgi:hypothetical protein
MMNLVVVLLGTFALAAVLIYFIAKHDRTTRLRTEAHAKAMGTEPALPDFREFSKVCMDLCESLKLEISDVSQPAGGEVAIRAASINPITRVEYLIAGFLLPRHSVLETSRVMELSDQIVSERLSKGIIVTTGRVDREAALRLPELAPIEFIDGGKLEQMLHDKEIFT